MNDTPFARGGVIRPPGPDSDLVPVRLSPGEPVISFELLRRYRAGELSWQEVLRQASGKPAKEVTDGDDNG